VEKEMTPLVATNNQSKAATNSRTKRLKTLMDNDIMHYAATIGIATTCYITAIRVPGVAVVWSLCGSFLAFLIAFILPAACYLEIQRTHPTHESKDWIWFSWALLVSATLSSIACTIQSISQLL
jgi:hypothetical protein